MEKNNKEKIVWAKAIKRSELVLTKETIEKHARGIFDFLRLVHPTAAIPKEKLPKGEKKGAIEIRFLLRGDGLTSGSLFSFNTWNLEEDDLQKLIEKLTKYNGYSACMYYSVFTYDFHKKFPKEKNFKIDDTKQKIEVMEEPKKIRKESVWYCESLPMDFDNITEEEFEEEKRRLLELDIETVDVFSGNGFQPIILLDEKCYDPTILSKFTKLLLRKGFKVDPSIDEPNRIMRSPFGFNCKQYAKDMPKYYNPTNPKATPTTIHSTTNKRYKLDVIMEKLESLKDVNYLDDTFEHFFPSENNTEADKSEEKTKGINTLPTKEKRENEPIMDVDNEENGGKTYKTGKPKENINVQVKSKKEFEELYKHLNYAALPEIIQNILMGTPLGVGNDVLLFLYPYLKNELKLSLQKQIETMQVWGDHCDPIWSHEEIRHEVIRLNKKYPNFQAKYGKYTENLYKMFGDLELVEWKNDDEIVIPNDVFKKIKHISEGAFRIYLAIKLLEHEEKRSNFTNDEICERAEIASRTFEKHIGYLTKQKLISRKQSYRKKGNKNEYYINPYESLINGFTKIKASLIELSLLKLNDAQTTLYMYLKHMIGNSKENCWASQDYLAIELGKSQNRISEITSILHDKKWIRKEAKKIGRVTHSTYLLLK